MMQHAPGFPPPRRGLQVSARDAGRRFRQRETLLPYSCLQGQTFLI